MRKGQKFMKKLSVGHTVLWLVLLIIIISSDIFFAGFLYNVLILTALMGLIGSLLMSLSLIWGQKVGNTELRNLYMLKTAARTAAGIDYLLAYLYVGLVFLVKGQVIIVPLAWGICSIVCVILLIVLKWKTRKIGASLEQ